MSPPRVLHKYNDAIPSDAIYVGRPSKWGNPYIIGVHGDRREVVNEYEDHLFRSGLINNINELTGKDLVCYCSPQLCHADILLIHANGKTTTQETVQLRFLL